MTPAALLVSVSLLIIALAGGLVVGARLLWRSRTPLGPRMGSPDDQAASRRPAEEAPSAGAPEQSPEDVEAPPPALLSEPDIPAGSRLDSPRLYRLRPAHAASPEDIVALARAEPEVAGAATATDAITADPGLAIGSEEEAFEPGEWEQWEASQEQGHTLHQPGAPKEPPALTEDSFQVVDIYFGTDRSSYRPDDENSGYSGGRAHRLRLGMSQVSVPKKRKSGSIPRPSKVLWFTLERPDPLFHFMIQQTSALSESEFTMRLNAAVDDQPGAGLLFVHGFNTSFDGALFRAAQLAVDLKVEGPMLLYSWPSSGSPLAYDFDSESVKQAREHFQAFMDLLSRTSLKRLNILAHSKGNELLLEMLGARPKSRLTHVRQVVLASPDVDCDFAQQIIGRTAHKVKGMTLYACAKDIALQVSQQKAGGVARAGDLLDDGFPLIVDGLDSIDASTSTLRLAEFNHNSFVADTVLRYDLARLLASGRRPPNDRSASITQQTCDRGVYWALQAR